MRYATNWCRSGKGPIILEMDVYRLFGHSMAFPGAVCNSRDKPESPQREYDPIIHFGRFMTENGLATHDEIKVCLISCHSHVFSLSVDCTGSCLVRLSKRRLV